MIKNDCLYGLLTYSTNNLGDEIQSVAARQFLPRVDLYIDRDFGLNKVKTRKRVKLILNGWFMHRPENFPPSPQIDPLFISFHISPLVASEMTRPSVIAYYKKHEPIGCRDYYTKRLLEAHGVDAYFSGCLTLTLDYKYGDKVKENKRKGIIIVDLDEKLVNKLPNDVLRQAELLSHKVYPSIREKTSTVINKKLWKIKDLCKQSELLRKAGRKILLNIYDLLSSIDVQIWKSNRRNSGFAKIFRIAGTALVRYANARLVITSRLHVALPCLAFNTPVAFIATNPYNPRYEGYEEYLRIYSTKEFIDVVEDIDWEDDKQLIKFFGRKKEISDIRDNLIRRIREFLNQ